MIPDAAVEAAAAIVLPYIDDLHFDLPSVVRATLEAAAPHIIAAAQEGNDEIFTPNACPRSGGRHEVAVSNSLTPGIVNYCRKCGAMYDGGERLAP